MSRTRPLGRFFVKSSSSGWNYRTSPIALAVATLSAVLALLAWASPGDPTWLPGLYDNGDFDDAVLALLSLDSVPTVKPVGVENIEVGPAPDSLPLQKWSPAPFDTASSRAPPLA
jgi:hypothetical protein